MKTALITGVTGQDGAYLALLLLERGYRVIGGMRRSSGRSTWRLDALGVADSVELVGIELLELSNLQRLLDSTRPDEIYSLAALSFVAASFDQPIYSADVDAMSGILFNYESPMRGLDFVPRKIIAGLARWKSGERRTLRLGNMAAARDGASPANTSVPSTAWCRPTGGAITLWRRARAIRCANSS